MRRRLAQGVQRTFLYDQPVEIYGNNWTGLVVNDEGGQVDAAEFILQNINLTVDGPSVTGPFTLVIEDDRNAFAGQLGMTILTWKLKNFSSMMCPSCSSV